jgi:hypothetical protein
MSLLVSLFSTWEVPESNLDVDINHPKWGFFVVICGQSRWHLKIGRDRFLLHRFQYIIHPDIADLPIDATDPMNM